MKTGAAGISSSATPVGGGNFAPVAGGVTVGTGGNDPRDGGAACAARSTGPFAGLVPTVGGSDAGVFGAAGSPELEPAGSGVGAGGIGGIGTDAGGGAVNVGGSPGASTAGAGVAASAAGGAGAGEGVAGTVT